MKGIHFDSSDPEVSGPDLFSCIVPMVAHEASSLYSEEQVKLLRTVRGEVEVANDGMFLYLSSMQLAMDYAVTVGVGRRYLTAVTKKAVGTQMGPSNSLRARYKTL